MNGHGNKLSRKHDQAIAALLTEPTIAAAAIKIGIGEATLQRWTKLPAFASAFRDARRRCVEVAIARLQQITSEAVDALRRNLTCGRPNAEVRAAVGILEHAIRAVETMDLVERIEWLEAENDHAKKPLRSPFAAGTASTNGHSH